MANKRNKYLIGLELNGPKGDVLGIRYKYDV